MEPSEPLPEPRFSWLSRADGTIVIRYGEAPITLLRGRAAQRFETRIATADGASAQRLMARATGSPGPSG